MIIICITVLLVVIAICITAYFMHRNRIKNIRIIAMNEYSRNQDILEDYDYDNEQLKFAANNLLNALDTINTIAKNI